MLRFILAACVVGTTVLTGALPVCANGAQQDQIRTFPPVELRGYGKLGGKQILSADSSVLIIECDSADAAKLVQAKYVSDLGLLPGVTEKAEGSLTLHVIDGQGVIVAGQNDSRVLIAAAKNQTELDTMIKKEAGSIDTWNWSARTAVPKFLDRWDRFSWRFYYRPWETPKGTKLTDYDPMTEFDFAKKSGDLGFVFWDQINHLDVAPDIMQEGWWKWAFDAASKRGLPISINGSAMVPSTAMRQRGDMAQGMPQFSGTYYRVATPDVGGLGTLSWLSKDARDVMLGTLQKSYAELNRDPNVISFLEPHGELKHGYHDILMEYGPLADAHYRSFLQAQYKDTSTLSERWYGRSDAIHNWQDVRVPEVASFLGWGSQAVDLAGTWRICQEQNNKIAPDEWYTADFDDSTWAKVEAPGNDHAMYMPKEPAVYRRHIQVDSAWRAKNKRAWLYVWDLNGNIGKSQQYGKPVIAAVNGKKVGEDNVKHPVPHWTAWEVSDALKDGDNLVAIRVPAGVFGYRVYFSPDAPVQYPYLGKQKNAQWVDFVEWIEASRIDAVRRGMEMIRQVTPDKNITLMAPDAYTAGIKRQAESYGGNFHNTGYMGVFWADLLPSLMRSSEMPFSVEPGGPARDLPELKRMLGYYFTEGVNAVDYFIHVGNIMWDEPMRNYFQDHLNLIHMIGKYHLPKADVAVLYSARANQLTAWPWGADPNTDLGAGYWNWNLGEVLLREFPRDGLTEDDIARGNADQYKVIVDTNTSVMDESTLHALEKWVRAGGTFVTYVQTGRHTPIEPNLWPISRLSGYRVLEVDQYKADFNPVRTRKIKAVGGQNMLTDGIWSADGGSPSGLRLVKDANDAVDLAKWDDGSVAIGMRPMGKGKIIQVGVRYGRIRDRFPDAETTDLYVRLVGMQHVARVAGKMTRADGKAGQSEILLRHYISNNGIYNVWAMSNTSDKTVRANLLMDHTVAASYATDVKNGQQLQIESTLGGATLANLEFAPNDTRLFLTPRNQIGLAPAEWFALQRGWWKGTRKPADVKLPVEESPWYMQDLTMDWSIATLRENDNVETLAVSAPTAGTRDRLGIFSTRENPANAHLLFRKAFRVSDRFTGGAVRFWLQAFHTETSIGQSRVFLDGKLIRDIGTDGITGVVIDALKPGSSHVLAIEVKSDKTLSGVRGSCWLSYEPTPERTIDLAGEWIPSPDGLRDDAPVQIPGTCKAAILRRIIELPGDLRNQNMLIEVEGTGRFVGVVVNGHQVRRHHHIIGTRMILNVTDYLKPGSANVIEIAMLDGAERVNIRSVKVNVYDPKTFPN